MVDYLLEKHPTKEGFFIDNGFGEPISKKSGHIFNFTFCEMNVSSTYSINRPYTIKTDEDGNTVPEFEDHQERDTLDLRIKMIPKNWSEYSYIGTRSLIEEYQLIISDLNDDMCDQDYPHLTFFSYHDREDPGKIMFSVFLFLEPERLDSIRKDITNEKINQGNISFTVQKNMGDLVFQSNSTYRGIPEDFLKDWDYDTNKYKHLGCFYPIKLLPSNFYDYDKNLINPYDKSPIREFHLTFGKTVFDKTLVSKFERTPDETKVIKDYQEYLMMEDPDNFY